MKQIDKKKLKKLYEENTIREASNKLGVNLPTLYRLLDDAGIPRKGKKKYVVV